MRIIVITAEAGVHKYFAHRVSSRFGSSLVGIMCVTGACRSPEQEFGEVRTGSSSCPPLPHDSTHGATNFVTRYAHRLIGGPFKRLSSAVTSRYPSDFPKVPLHGSENASDEASLAFVHGLRPELVLGFDVGAFKGPLLSIAKHWISLCKIIYPLYEGVDDPSTAIRRLDLRHVGSSILYYTSEADRWGVVSWVLPELKANDPIETITRKVVRAGTDRTLEIVEKIREGEPLPRNYCVHTDGEYPFFGVSDSCSNRVSKEVGLGVGPPGYAGSGLATGNNLGASRRGRGSSSDEGLSEGCKLANGLYAVFYHHITGQDRLDEAFWGTTAIRKIATDSERFESHVTYYREHFTVVSFQEALAILRRYDGNVPDRFLVISFDDGYASVLERADPVLRKHGCPYTLFVCGDPVLRQKGLARLRLGKLLQDTPERVLASFKERFGKSFVKAAHLWNEWKNHWSEDYNQLTHDLWSELTTDEAAEYEHTFYLSLSDLRPLDPKRVTIGSHTYEHPMLSRLSPHEQEREIRACHLALQEALDREVPLHSYPFGGAASFDQVSELILLGLKGVCGVSAYGSINRFFHPTNIVRIGFTNESVSEVDRILKSYC